MQLSQGFPSILHRIFLRDRHEPSISKSPPGPCIVLYSLHTPLLQICLFKKKALILLLYSDICHCANSSLFTKLASNESCVPRVKFCVYVHEATLCKTLCGALANQWYIELLNISICLSFCSVSPNILENKAPRISDCFSGGKYAQ